MPKIDFSGGKTAFITKEQAKKLALWKWGDEENGVRPMPPNKNFEVSGFGICEVKDIKRILDDENTTQDYEANTEKRKAEIEDWLIAVAGYIEESPEEKAERMVRTGCYLCHKSKGNEGNITAELKEKLKTTLIAWFEENPKEWWADKSIYEFLIPKVERTIPVSNSGFKSIGQLISNK